MKSLAAVDFQRLADDALVLTSLANRTNELDYAYVKEVKATTPHDGSAAQRMLNHSC